MVDNDVKTMYGKVREYLTAKAVYFEDATSVPIEFNDVNSEFNLASLVQVLQRQVTARPSRGEASSMKAYRDIRSTQAEYDIRLMKRTDYLSDSAIEERDNIDKWLFNEAIIEANMVGKDTGA